MTHAIRSLFVALVFNVVLVSQSATADDPPVVDIRDSDGKPLVAAHQIRSYDWETHALTLTQGTRAKLAERLIRGIGISPEKKIVSGIPFSLCLDGQPIYKGNFTTSASSKSFATPVILIEPPLPQDNLTLDEIHIQLGYPTEKFFEGNDPRGDQRIHDALEPAGKLVNLREDRIRWVADALLEMQSITKGMTRGELKKVFVEEGGLSGRFQRRYAYRDCPYMKVDVKFEAVDSPEDKSNEHATDRITQISTPFLEWQISD
jgi:hypothetical protein